MKIKTAKITTIASLVALVTACGSDIKTMAEINTMSPAEVATFTCNTIKEANLEQAKIFFEKSQYADFEKESKKEADTWAQNTTSMNCTVKSSKETKSYTRFKFIKGIDSVKVKKIDGNYIVLLG
ncbi:hypothetical protein H4J58_09415 [Colwellia sp. MB3u-70]|uniref:hypothetical protein n=1 Tax=unclassified Colwellia TaxID=196834 RepID=UPI0015F56216|nr:MULTISPECIES: hypothetical protein [unclassified Colwellia]MBA6291254.1 hypothetical protein [Colwellia sp. MB3u-8]MBA6307330.1 hypothetical protein [Colwellia sp. MB3u-70]